MPSRGSRNLGRRDTSGRESQSRAALPSAASLVREFLIPVVSHLVGRFSVSVDRTTRRSTPRSTFFRTPGLLIDRLDLPPYRAVRFGLEYDPGSKELLDFVAEIDRAIEAAGSAGADTTARPAPEETA